MRRAAPGAAEPAALNVPRLTAPTAPAYFKAGPCLPGNAREMMVAALYRVYAALMTTLRMLHKPVTLGVRVLVEDADGRVLLVRHTYLPGWYLPGGGIKSRETLHEAAMRELAEETGIMARETPRLFAAYTNFHQSKPDHVLLYTLRRFEQGQWSPGFEIAQCGFFPHRELPGDVSPATLRRLEEYRTGAPPALHW